MTDTPLWLQDTSAGALERERLDWAFIARTLKQCRAEIESDGSRHSWIDPAENIARERAKLKASEPRRYDECAQDCQMSKDYGFSPREGHSCSGPCAYDRKAIEELSSIVGPWPPRGTR